jgi:putative NADPH-quinone reductase
VRLVLVVDRSGDDASSERPGEGLIGRITSAATTTGRQAGNVVDVIDLVRDGFSPVMTRAEREAYFAGTPIVSPEIADYAGRLDGADTLGFVYRTRLATVSPLLKGWIDRTLVTGVAFTMNARGSVERDFGSVRQIIGISTYDASRWQMVRRGDNGRRLIGRNVRLCAGVRARCTWLALYGATEASDSQVEHFVDRVEARMRSR